MKNKFNIGDKVYHITPESPIGIVLDIRYYFRSDEYEYLISWGHSDSTYATEDELSVNKRYDN